MRPHRIPKRRRHQFDVERQEERRTPRRTERLNFAAVRPVAKTKLQPGVVVWAHVPFEELDADKTRPAVVKAVVGRNVTLLPGTTAASRYRYPGRYYELTDLAAAGLSRETGICLEERTVDLIEIVQIIGMLADADAVAAHDRTPLASSEAAA